MCNIKFEGDAATLFCIMITNTNTEAQNSKQSQYTTQIFLLIAATAQKATRENKISKLDTKHININYTDGCRAIKGFLTNLPLSLPKIMFE